MLRRRLNRRSERGAVLVFVAPLFLTLFAMTALVVDMGNARQEARHVQGSVVELNGNFRFNTQAPDQAPEARLEDDFGLWGSATFAGVHAADRLDARIAETGSIACVGLDPRPDLLPPSLLDRHRSSGTPAEAVAAAFTETNRRIIDAVAARCAAVKPQAACYEAYGLPGWRALQDTVRHATEAGIPVILDAKRGDIGSTATHYGQMAFGGAPDLDGEGCEGMGADWLTVNGYLGSDGVEPVLAAGGGVFVLVKTSNPGSGELQDLQLADGGTVADRMADQVAAWGAVRVGASGLSDVGAVVGATYPAHAVALRDRMPDTVFLVPGYGAQGGSARDAVAGRRPDGRGVLVSSSRGITGAWQQAGTDDVGAAARAALDAMNAELDAAR